MYTLDAREIHVLRHALNEEGSTDSRALLAELPETGHPPADIEGERARTAARALDAFADAGKPYGYLALELADTLLGRKRPRKGELLSARN